ncbi:rho GTPase-activating protein 7-like [Spea bombifrons]|uniref:rho GTPase-activating protein 7-like n=1 Tax=Spea bombifrons TaxID=233779 RepID=UPI0023494589|nr:rho GTPase-activating protein 7-like [Spea bombifrons]
MSVVIRKRSWEDHETQWLGLSSNIAVYDALCCRGFTTDHLKSTMEEHEVLAEKQKGAYSSFSECCSLGHYNGVFENQGPLSNKADENDNLDKEGVDTSSDTSREAVASFPGEDEKPNFSEYAIVQYGEEDVSVNKNVEENGKYEETEKCEADTIHVAKQPAKGVQKDTNNKNNQDSLKESDFIIDATKEILCKHTDVEEIVTSGEQLLQSAVIAQQRRKFDASKDVHEKKIYDVVLDDSHCGPCSAVCSQISETGLQSGFNGSHLCPNGVLKENCVQNIELKGSNNPKKNPRVIKPEFAQCLQFKDNGTSSASGYGHVRLRRKKKLRDERSRLDSMVLLLMKLDQLDQDIENALITPSPPDQATGSSGNNPQETQDGTEDVVDPASVGHSLKNVSQTVATDWASYPGFVNGAKPRMSTQFSWETLLVNACFVSVACNANSDLPPYQ